MRLMIAVVMVIVFFGCVVDEVKALPAFPGAVGFGSETIGGRGGRVIEVTNLNDSGAGSFREAVSAKGARVVVFRVSGIIDAKSIIYIENPNITIAGQTSPGGGIAIRGAPIFVRASDVIIRGLRMRIGDLEGVKGSDRDGISVWGDATHKVNNIMIDHNSIAWGVDENTSVWDESTDDNKITFSWNIIAEALHCSIHIDEQDGPGCHSMGMLIESPRGQITVHHNLFASNNDRNPAIKSGNVEFADNVLYNWGQHSISFFGGNLHLIGNTIIGTMGSSDWIGDGLEAVQCEGNPGKLYMESNVGPDNLTDWNSVVCTGTLKDSIFSEKQIFKGSGAWSPANQSYSEVVAGAGAIRDLVDDRIIKNVRDRSKPSSNWIINSQSEVGGWPSYSGTPKLDNDHDGMPDNWEQSRGGDLRPETISPSGYSWIEEYVNSFFPINIQINNGESTPTPTTAQNNSPVPTSTISCAELRKKADANCDGVVDILDYSMWYKQFYDGGKGEVIKSSWEADFTGINGTPDGKVDIYDYSMWFKMARV